MPSDISPDVLYTMYTKWLAYDLPSGVQEKIEALSSQVMESIGDVIFAIYQFDEKTGYEFGEKTAEVVMPALMLCYFIGYELASGKMQRKDGTDYLIAATEPIQSFILGNVSALAKQGIPIQDNHKKELMVTAKLVGDMANELCVLGIDNFTHVNYR